MKKIIKKVLLIISAATIVVASIIGAVILMSGEHEHTGNNTGTEGTGNNTGGGENNSGGNETEKNNHTTAFWRTYDVILDSSGNYTVLLPVVLDNNGISFIMDGLSLVKGDASFEIVNSTYGPALKVTGHGKVELKSDYEINAAWAKGKTYPVYAEKPDGTPVNVTDLVMTLSMMEFRELNWDSENASYVPSDRAYNTTNSSFRDSPIWKEYIDDMDIFLPTPVSLHSFVYVSAEEPVTIKLDFYDSLLNGVDWILSNTFTENGWHYVKLNVEEGPVE